MAKSETSGCTWIVLVFIIIGAVWVGKSVKDTPPKSPAQHREEMVITTAQKAVRERLKDPRSGEFEYMQSRIAEAGAGRVIVSGKVRATNSFGATIETPWAVEMKEAGEKWEVLKVDVK
jgi:hypothetical protein